MLFDQPQQMRQGQILQFYRSNEHCDIRTRIHKKIKTRYFHVNTRILSWKYWSTLE